MVICANLILHRWVKKKKMGAWGMRMTSQQAQKRKGKWGKKGTKPARFIVAQTKEHLEKEEKKNRGDEPRGGKKKAKATYPHCI